MTDTSSKKPLPRLPPPQTRIVDKEGRMTKEFYDYLLRLVAALEAQIEALR